MRTVQKLFFFNDHFNLSFLPHTSTPSCLPSLCSVTWSFEFSLLSLCCSFLLSCVYTSVTSCSRLLCCPHWWFPKLLHLCLVNSVYPHLLLPCLSCQFGSSTREWTSVKLLDFCLCVFSSGQFFWPWVWQFGGFFPAPLDSFQVSVLSAFIDYSFKVSLKLPSNLPGVPVLHQPYCLYFAVIFLVIYGQWKFLILNPIIVY